MQTRLATDSDTPAWDNYALQNPLSNPYLLSAWSNAVSSAYGHNIYRLISVDVGGNLVGVLPLVHIKHPIFGNTLFSMPYADLGGVIANDDQTATSLVDHAVQIASENNIPTIELRQSSDLNIKVTNFHHNTATVNKVRMILDLPETADELMAGLGWVTSYIRRYRTAGRFLQGVCREHARSRFAGSRKKVHCFCH